MMKNFSVWAMWLPVSKETTDLNTLTNDDLNADEDLNYSKRSAPAVRFNALAAPVEVLSTRFPVNGMETQAQHLPLTAICPH